MLPGARNLTPFELERTRSRCAVRCGLRLIFRNEDNGKRVKMEAGGNRQIIFEMLLIFKDEGCREIDFRCRTRHHQNLCATWPTSVCRRDSLLNAHSRLFDRKKCSLTGNSVWSATRRDLADGEKQIELS